MQVTWGQMMEGPRTDGGLRTRRDPLTPKWSLARGRPGMSWVRPVLADARTRMAAVQLAAVGASVALLVLTGLPSTPGTVWLWLVVVVGLALLRVLSTGASLATSTLLLEPIGVVVLLSGTGGPSSPFLPMAFAGIWWAAGSSRRERTRAYRIARGPGGLRLERGQEVEIGARRRLSVVYGISMAVAYAALIAPPSIRDGVAPEALEDAVALTVAWWLAELATRRRPARAQPTTSAPTSPPTTAAAPPMLLRTAEQQGISAEDGQLLAYLALGLGNRRIAKAMDLSEGAVRYRLRRVYRSLGVNGRRDAVARARELNLAVPIEVLTTVR